MSGAGEGCEWGGPGWREGREAGGDGDVRAIWSRASEDAGRGSRRGGGLGWDVTGGLDLPGLA